MAVQNEVWVIRGMDWEVWRRVWSVRVVGHFGAGGRWWVRGCGERGMARPCDSGRRGSLVSFILRIETLKVLAGLNSLR